MTKFLLKIEDIFSHIGGVLGWIACTIGSFVAGYEGMFLLLFFSVLLDAFWGIANAIHAKRFVLSDLMRATVAKILSYCSVFLVIIGIEKILRIDSTIASAVVVGVIALTELWSVCGHILIRFPNIVFFRLLRPALVGEISRKLNISEEEVQKTLNNGTKGKKTLQKK